MSKSCTRAKSCTEISNTTSETKIERSKVLTQEMHTSSNLDHDAFKCGDIFEKVVKSIMWWSVIKGDQISHEYKPDWWQILLHVWRETCLVIKRKKVREKAEGNGRNRFACSFCIRCSTASRNTTIRSRFPTWWNCFHKLALHYQDEIRFCVNYKKSIR